MQRILPAAALTVAAMTTLAFAGGPLCQSGSFGQAAGTVGAYNSTDANQFIAADDFTPAADGTVIDLCWYGVSSAPAVPNDFTVTYYADDDGQPGAVYAGPFALGDVAGADSGLDVDGTSLSILVYSASHAGVAVSAGTCYWISIENDVDADNDGGEGWYWSLAQTSTTEPLYAGNGRAAADGPGADGFDKDDLVGSMDLAFFVGLELSKPSCGLDTVFNTGPERKVEFDPTESGACAPTFLGHSAFPQSRTAQALTVAAPLPEGPAQSWRVRQILVTGFSPGAGEVNDDLEFEVYSRNGTDRPTVEDSLLTGSVPFSAAERDTDHPQGGSSGSIHGLHVDFALPPGDYWLSVWASNGVGEASNFVWFDNPPGGITLLDGGGDAFMWRSTAYPDPGFEDVSFLGSPVYCEDATDTHKTAFMVRGTAGGVCGDGNLDPGETCDDGNTASGDGCNSICQDTEPCPWDCDGSNDGIVGVDDFLAVLAQWGQTGSSCAMGLGPAGVGVEEFLAVFAHWGACP